MGALGNAAGAIGKIILGASFTVVVFGALIFVFRNAGVAIVAVIFGVPLMFLAFLVGEAIAEIVQYYTKRIR